MNKVIAILEEQLAHYDLYASQHSNKTQEYSDACKEIKEALEYLKLYNNFNRVEVIDNTGRVFVKHNIKTQTSIQDNGKTLKLFIK